MATGRHLFGNVRFDASREMVDEAQIAVRRLFPGRRKEHREKNGNNGKDEQVRGAKEKRDWRVQMILVKREGTWKENIM